MLRFIGKKGILFLTLAGLAAIVHLSQQVIDRNREIHFVNQSPQFLPRGQTLKWLSMGYRGLMADWFWMKTVLYYGRRVIDEDNPYFTYSRDKGTLQEELSAVPQTFNSDTVLALDESLKKVLFRMESRGLVNYVYPMLDRVTDLDPHFILPYIFGGVYVLMDTGEVDKSYSLLEKGYSNNPDDWHFPFYLAWIDWMYKGDVRKAYSLMLKAVDKPECPLFVGRLLAGISSNLNRSQLTRMYLEGLLQSTDNEEVRQQILEVLKELDKNESSNKGD